MKHIKERDNNLNKNMEMAGEDAKKLKNLAQDQGVELRKQIKQTDRIIQRVEETEVRMKKISGKLESFVASSSDRKVWIYIAIQCIIFLLLIILQ